MERKNKTFNNKMKKILILLTIFFVALNIFTMDDSHNWGGDFSAYISQGRALADGSLSDLVRDSDFRLAVSEAQVGPNLYPWGFPLILAPVVTVFGVNIVALKFAIFLFFIGSLVLVYFLFKGKLKDESVWIILLILSASPYIFIFKQDVLSDIPAMFFLLLSVLFTQKIYFEDENNKDKNVHSVFLGVSIFLSIFIRTSSAILLPFLFIIQALRGRYWLKKTENIIVGLLPYLLVVFLYIISIVAFPKSSYADHFLMNTSAILGLIWRNTPYYFVLFSEFFGKPTNILVIIIYYFILAFFLLGLWKGFKKYYTFVLFIVITLGLFLIYPYHQGLRFVVPLIPFILFFAMYGIEQISLGKILENGPERIARFFVFFILIVFSIQIFPIVGVISSADGPYSKNSKELFNFIIQNTDSKSTISFFKPRVMYLFTGRGSAFISSVEFLSQSDVDYFVFTKGVDMQKTKDYLDQSEKLIFGNDQFRVYDLR
jgi:hypothetical protein